MGQMYLRPIRLQRVTFIIILMGRIGSGARGAAGTEEISECFLSKGSKETDAGARAGLWAEEEGVH